MALVMMKNASDIEWYGAGPFPAELMSRENDPYWDVITPRYPHTLLFKLHEVFRVPAHRMDDREPSLDGFYTTTLGKHRKGELTWQR